MYSCNAKDREKGVVCPFTLCFFLSTLTSTFFVPKLDLSMCLLPAEKGGLVFLQDFQHWNLGAHLTALCFSKHLQFERKVGKSVYSETVWNLDPHTVVQVWFGCRGLTSKVLVPDASPRRFLASTVLTKEARVLVDQSLFKAQHTESEINLKKYSSYFMSINASWCVAALARTVSLATVSNAAMTAFPYKTAFLGSPLQSKRKTTYHQVFPEIWCVRLAECVSKLLSFKLGSSSLPAWYKLEWLVGNLLWKQMIVVLNCLPPPPQRAPSSQLCLLRSKSYTQFHFFPVLDVPQLISCQQLKFHFQNYLQALTLFLLQAEEIFSTLIQKEGKMTFYITRP